MRTLAILPAFALLAGCGGLQILSGGPTPNQGAPLVHRAPSSYQVIYSFQGGNDGAFPQPEAAPLTVINGTLHGTTSEGGGATFCGNGCGVLYKLSASGSESVLYRFQGTPDGQLARVNGPTGKPFARSPGRTGTRKRRRPSIQSHRSLIAWDVPSRESLRAGRVLPVLSRLHNAERGLAP